MVTMPLDPELSDYDLGSEIELLADVIDVASSCQGCLSQDEIDSALGLGSADSEEERSHPLRTSAPAAGRSADPGSQAHEGLGAKVQGSQDC